MKQSSAIQPMELILLEHHMSGALTGFLVPRCTPQVLGSQASCQRHDVVGQLAFCCITSVGGRCLLLVLWCWLAGMPAAQRMLKQVLACRMSSTALRPPLCSAQASLLHTSISIRLLYQRMQFQVLACHCMLCGLQSRTICTCHGLLYDCIRQRLTSMMLVISYCVQIAEHAVDTVNAWQAVLMHLPNPGCCLDIMHSLVHCMANGVLVLSST